MISQTDTVVIDTAGDYVVEIADSNGCITRDTIVVTNNFTAPSFNVSSIDIDCESGMGSVFIVSDSIFEVSWELPDGSIVTGDSINSNIEGTHVILSLIHI